MLIKEETMRRVLYITILLALLAIPAGNAFAQDGICPFGPEPNPDGVWILGEIWWTPDWMGDPNFVDPDCWNWGAGDRVDTWMTRYSTEAGWPWAWGPVFGTWWWEGGASEQRRMSYEFTGDDYKYANAFGGYYSQFMLPRDEVWFPCSYPYKWKCNYQLALGVWEIHSPAVLVTDFCIGAACMNPWPWFVYSEGDDMYYQLFNPDTVSPVQIDIFDPSESPQGYSFELEIAGYFWKLSDLEEPWYMIVADVVP
jgi:hypothetical protein